MHAIVILCLSQHRLHRLIIILRFIASSNLVPLFTIVSVEIVADNAGGPVGAIAAGVCALMQAFVVARRLL